MREVWIKQPVGRRGRFGLYFFGYEFGLRLYPCDWRFGWGAIPEVGIRWYLLIGPLHIIEAEEARGGKGGNVTPSELALLIAFVQGAEWWEWHKEGATMWQSNQWLAAQEALRRLGNKTLGTLLTPEHEAFEALKEET